MGSCMDYVFRNAYPEDAADAEQRIREKYPLLLHQDETIKLAYRDRAGKGRDKNYFTTHRILLKDGKGIGSRCKSYKSIPYASIQAWKVETAGDLDGDSHLKVWSSGVPSIQISFAKNEVDLWEIQHFLNEKYAEKLMAKKPELKDMVMSTPQPLDQGVVTSVWDWMGDNAKQIDPAEVEPFLKQQYPVLFPDEKIDLVFKSGRDYNVFTPYRYMFVDVKGITGKAISFKTLSWSSIKAYSVQTAGAFLDRDTEMYLYTDIFEMSEITQDFRKNQTDIFQIQKCLCNYILFGEMVESPPSLMEAADDVTKVDHKAFRWFRENQRPLDAAEMDRQYHAAPNLLMEREHVEMAFKGWRDITLFTNLRLILIDPKGLVGKQIEYKSYPWTSIVGYHVQTAGKYLDFDTEVGFYTDLDFYPGDAGNPEADPPEPPTPAEPKESYFEIEFNKDLVDMNAMNYYLSQRIMTVGKMEVGAPIKISDNSVNLSTSMFDKILGLLGSDQTEIDPEVMNAELHGSTKILLDDEKVIMAFKGYRDVEVFTNLRVLSIDRQGFFGVKISYRSTPYKSIKAWGVETAGLWDVDTNLKLYTRNRWHMAELDLDFRTGKVDIAQINYFLSALIIGLPSDEVVDLGRKDYNSGSQEANPINFSSFGILGNMWEVDAQEIERKLRNDPCLLLKEEMVLRAFQSGRDLVAYTNRRMIVIDTKGITGKRVEYKSMPWRFVDGYKIQTAGFLDRDGEIELYYTCADYIDHGPPRMAPQLKTRNSLLVKEIDIYEVGKIFTDILLFNKEEEEKYVEEPEVVFPEWYTYS